MALYLVSYDISAQNHDYQRVWTLLEQWKATKILYSGWLVVANADMEGEITRLLWQQMHASDHLLVLEVTGNASWADLLITDDECDELLRKTRY